MEIKIQMPPKNWLLKQKRKLEIKTKQNGRKQEDRIEKRENTKANIIIYEKRGKITA